MPFPALRGSFRPVLCSGVVSALRVTHLGPGLGSRRSVAEGAPATAGQRGGGSPARVFWATLGATGYRKRRKREQGIKACSPKPEIEQ